MLGNRTNWPQEGVGQGGGYCDPGLVLTLGELEIRWYNRGAGKQISRGGLQTAWMFTEYTHAVTTLDATGPLDKESYYCD